MLFLISVLRTTVKLDDELAKELRRSPYQLATVSLGGLCADVNLDKALSLADAIEDEEIVRKLMLSR